MKENLVNVESMDVDTGGFDKLIEWLLIALLAFMPFAFGAVEAWSEEVVIAGFEIMGLLGLFVLAKNLGPIDEVRGTFRIHDKITRAIGDFRRDYRRQNRFEEKFTLRD